ncbi:NAD(P)-binding protein [Stemphylium lycopersici]|uniref:NAD(P)-binding protein n=1 Tax=Stemphylium lycopersici TaxID=183478 RepID=A0A364N4P8_STELY|nr:NAD(P)-binding protein [Stemphylium lycopersici]
MVTVAVAGGTGGIGRTIVEELTTALPGLESVPVIEADYNNVASMRELLKVHNIGVVISTLALFTEESAQAQMNLIQAAIDSGSVTRFIPSEYGINYSHPGLLEFHPTAKWWLDAADLLRESRLDFTRIIFGWLSDYFGMPHAKSNMKPFKYALDFDNRKAAIPGDGMAPVTFLHSTDVAKYIAALLEEEAQWPEISAFASDKLTWNGLVELAEKVTGQKWDVTYDRLAQLERGQATLFEPPEGSYNLPEDATRQMMAEFGVMAVKGLMDVSGQGLRNNAFPAVQPITVEALIRQAWGSQEE